MTDINKDVLYYAATVADMVALDLRTKPVTDAKITRAQVTATLEFLVEHGLIFVASDEQIGKATVLGLPPRAKRHDEIVAEAITGGGPHPEGSQR